MDTKQTTMSLASHVSVHDDDASRLSRLSESSDSNSQSSFSYLGKTREVIGVVGYCVQLFAVVSCTLFVFICENH